MYLIYQALVVVDPSGQYVFTKCNKPRFCVLWNHAASCLWTLRAAMMPASASSTALCATGRVERMRASPSGPLRAWWRSWRRRRMSWTHSSLPSPPMVSIPASVSPSREHWTAGCRSVYFLHPGLSLAFKQMEWLCGTFHCYTTVFLLLLIITCFDYYWLFYVSYLHLQILLSRTIHLFSCINFNCWVKGLSWRIFFSRIQDENHTILKVSL